MAAFVETVVSGRGVLTFFSRKYKNILSNSCFITRNNHSESSSKDENYDIIITGGGMVGTTLACAIANNRVLESKRVLLLEGGKEHTYQPQDNYSNRVVALNQQTRTLLSSIGAWQHIEAVRYAPVRKMQVWDACSDAMITFNEDHLSEELAYIVENDLLLHAANTQLAKMPSIRVVYNARVDNIVLPKRQGEDSNITLQSGETFKAKLLVSQYNIFIEAYTNYII